jgi:high-affinity Fe2+/Pb2+ permease
MRENKEITMLTQGYITWLIIALMTFLTWLICSFLIYSGLQYFNVVSSDYSLVIGAVLSAVGVGLAEHRFLYKY